MSHINRVVYIMYTENKRTYVDLYVRAQIKDFDYAKGDACRFTEKIPSNLNKKFKMIVRDVKNSVTYSHPGDKVLKREKIYHWDESKFKDCGKFVAKDILITKIKNAFLDEKGYTKTTEFNTGFSDDEAEVDTKETSVVSLQEEAKILMSEIMVKKTKSEDLQNPIHNSITSIQEDAIDEQSRSERSLIRCGFLTPGEYYVSNGVAWLHKPFGHAYGDLLINRGKPYLYKRDGWMVNGMTRLAREDFQFLIDKKH